jgi:hypothetical protein
MAFSTLFGASCGILVKFTSNTIRKLPLLRGECDARESYRDQPCPVDPAEGASEVNYRRDVKAGPAMPS